MGRQGRRGHEITPRPGGVPIRGALCGVDAHLPMPGGRASSPDLSPPTPKRVAFRIIARGPLTDAGVRAIGGVHRRPSAGVLIDDLVTPREVAYQLGYDGTVTATEHDRVARDRSDHRGVGRAFYRCAPSSADGRPGGATPSRAHRGRGGPTASEHQTPRACRATLPRAVGPFGLFPVPAYVRQRHGYRRTAGAQRSSTLSAYVCTAIFPLRTMNVSEPKTISTCAQRACQTMYAVSPSTAVRSIVNS